MTALNSFRNKGLDGPVMGRSGRIFPEYEPRDTRFNDYFNDNCRLEKLYIGTMWAEGPVYFCDGDFLLWSDIPNDRLRIVALVPKRSFL